MFRAFLRRQGRSRCLSTGNDAPSSCSICPWEESLYGCLSAMLLLMSRLSIPLCLFVPFCKQDNVYWRTVWLPKCHRWDNLAVYEYAEWITHHMPDSAGGFLQATTGYGHAGCTHFAPKGPERGMDEQKPKMKHRTPKPRTLMLKLAEAKAVPFISLRLLCGAKDLHLKDCTITLHFS